MVSQSVSVEASRWCVVCFLTESIRSLSFPPLFLVSHLNRPLVPNCSSLVSLPRLPLPLLLSTGEGHTGRVTLTVRAGGTD